MSRVHLCWTHSSTSLYFLYWKAKLHTVLQMQSHKSRRERIIASFNLLAILTAVCYAVGCLCHKSTLLTNIKTLHEKFLPITKCIGIFSPYLSALYMYVKLMEAIAISSLTLRFPCGALIKSGNTQIISLSC